MNDSKISCTRLFGKLFGWHGLMYIQDCEISSHMTLEKRLCEQDFRPTPKCFTFRPSLSQLCMQTLWQCYCSSFSRVWNSIPTKFPQINKEDAPSRWQSKASMTPLLRKNWFRPFCTWRLTTTWSPDRWSLILHFSLPIIPAKGFVCIVLWKATLALSCERLQQYCINILLRGKSVRCCKQQIDLIWAEFTSCLLAHHFYLPSRDVQMATELLPSWDLWSRQIVLISKVETKFSSTVVEQ